MIQLVPSLKHNRSIDSAINLDLVNIQKKTASTRTCFSHPFGSVSAGRSLSDCKSLLLNVMIQLSHFFCSSGSLTAAKFILMSILQNKSKLNNSVKNNKKITNNIILLFSYSSFRCLPLQKVYLLLFPNLLFYLLFFAGCFFTM